jgi:hypothetical protein
MNLRMKRPSPAFVVAMVAMFIALGGTAGAAITAAVPLAKRALVADNAKKLEGKSAAQIGAAAAAAALSQSPAGARPASTAAGLVVMKTVPFNVAADAEQVVTATCDAGSKVVGGGFSNPTNALVLSAGSFATTDGAGWTEDLVNVSSSTGGSGNVVAMCLK